MSSRISPESWAGFIGGYFVAGAIFGIGFFLPSLVRPLSPIELQREELIQAGEGLLLAAASLFIGIRLLMVGQRYFVVATWYAAVCLLLTNFPRGTDSISLRLVQRLCDQFGRPDIHMPAHNAGIVALCSFSLQTAGLTMRWSEQRTAVRSTFEMISTLLLRATRGFVRRRSSYSR